MVNVSEASTIAAIDPGHQPQRLHHLAYTTYDMEATRRFYEEVIGMTLTQTWIENPTEGPLAGRKYVHCFYSLADGGAIAYFEHLGVEKPENRPSSGFHIAFKVTREAQDGIYERLLADGATLNGQPVSIQDHGYCLSLYVSDPNGLTVEFTVDCEDIASIVKWQNATCHEELKRWQAGDSTPNNAWRPDGH